MSVYCGYYFYRKFYVFGLILSNIIFFLFCSEMVLVVVFCVILDMLFVWQMLRFLRVDMMLYMGDGNGIVLVGNSGMNLCCLFLFLLGVLQVMIYYYVIVFLWIYSDGRFYMIHIVFCMRSDYFELCLYLSFQSCCLIYYYSFNMYMLVRKGYQFLLFQFSLFGNIQVYIKKFRQFFFNCSLIMQKGQFVCLGSIMV